MWHRINKFSIAFTLLIILTLLLSVNSFSEETLTIQLDSCNSTYLPSGYKAFHLSEWTDTEQSYASDSDYGFVVVSRHKGQYSIATLGKAMKKTGFVVFSTKEDPVSGILCVYGRKTDSSGREIVAVSFSLAEDSFFVQAWGKEDWKGLALCIWFVQGIKTNHTVIIDKAITASCTETGLTEGKHCSVCNEVLVAQEEIPAKGHTEVIDEAKAATYTETGLTEGKHCSVCGEVLVAQEIIPKHELHGTLSVSGNTSYIDCAVDMKEGTAPYTYLITLLLDGEVKNTFTCNSTEYSGARFWIDGDDGTYTSTVEVTDALGKTGYIKCQTYCCIKDGSVSTAPICPECESKDIAILSQVDATCTESGLTEGMSCSACKTVLVAQEDIPALGHTEVLDEAVDATCTEPGLTEGKHCSVCNEVLVAQEVVPATGHEMKNGICTVCGYHDPEKYTDLGKTGWVQNADGSWSYGDSDGYTVVGVINDGGTKYCFDEKGKMAIGWAQVDGKWYFAEESGALVTGWKSVGGTWYYFKNSGEMATGWVSDGGVWYFMKDSGAMATGWVESGKDWYYMNDNGTMATGWVKSGSDWYFMKSTGVMATGWIRDGGWYYFNGSGKMVTGWQRIDGSWYYFKSSGAMQTGWFEDKEAEKQLPANQKKALWYWFDNGGTMATGWKEIDGQWEMFDDSGLWLYTWDGN